MKRKLEEDDEIYLIDTPADKKSKQVVFKDFFKEIFHGKITREWETAYDFVKQCSECFVFDEKNVATSALTVLHDVCDIIQTRIFNKLPLETFNKFFESFFEAGLMIGLSSYSNVYVRTQYACVIALESGEVKPYNRNSHPKSDVLVCVQDKDNQDWILCELKMYRPNYFSSTETKYGPDAIIEETNIINPWISRWKAATVAQSDMDKPFTLEQCITFGTKQAREYCPKGHDCENIKRMLIYMIAGKIRYSDIMLHKSPCPNKCVTQSIMPDPIQTNKFNLRWIECYYRNEAKINSSKTLLLPNNKNQPKCIFAEGLEELLATLPLTWQLPVLEPMPDLFTPIAATNPPPLDFNFDEIFRTMI